MDRLPVVSLPSRPDQRIMHRNCNAKGAAMKTATIPSLRVDPELRAAAESVLKEGETLSALVEDSLRKQVHIRRSQAEFIARGLTGLEEAQRTGVFYTTDDIEKMMRHKLDNFKAGKTAEAK
jgi:hypothetical protein